MLPIGKISGLVICLFWIGLVNVESSRAMGASARIIRPDAGAERIPELSIEEMEPEIVPMYFHGEAFPGVHFKGHLDSKSKEKGLKLRLHDLEIPAVFDLKIALRAPWSELVFTSESARPPADTAKEESIKFHFRDWGDWRAEWYLSRSSLSEPHFSIALNEVSLGYTETGVGSFSSKSQEIEVFSGVPIFSPYWEATFGARWTPLAFSQPLPDGTRELSGEVFVRHFFRRIRLPWRVGFGVGMLYRSFSDANQTLGFKNILGGPAIQIPIAYALNTKHSLRFAFGLAPLSANATSMTERELSVHFDWAIKTEHLGGWHVRAGYSDSNFKSGPNHWFSTQTLRLGIGFDT